MVCILKKENNKKKIGKEKLLVRILQLKDAKKNQVKESGKIFEVLKNVEEKKLRYEYVWTGVRFALIRF